MIRPKKLESLFPETSKQKNVIVTCITADNFGMKHNKSVPKKICITWLKPVNTSKCDGQKDRQKDDGKMITMYLLAYAGDTKIPSSQMEI